MSALPATMTAVEITQPGGPDVLKPVSRPLPAIKPHEVLIEVEAAGVNRPDCFQRAGTYNPPPGASDLPGLEVAGTIVRTGADVMQWQVGDRVCALTPGGGYAQYCAAPAGHCLPIPKGFGAIEAASLPETLFTVWINVFERAKLATGETLLVQGGSSGIGVTAIQLARAFDHRVFVTAGSDEKCRACEALGAERAINYRTEDFVAVTKQLTGGKGVDVILDMVGGDYVPRELKALATDGRLAIIAFLGGTTATLDMSDILYRRLTVTGSTLRPRTIEFKTSMAAALRAKVWPLLDAGKIRPVIHSTFPLVEAAKAHALMESSAHVGKIMLRLAQGS
jgi:NADPH2:quinone reductase